MTSFWSKHTWFRRTISTLAIVLAVCIVALLSLAYVYMPPEDRTHTPTYLRWMQARHLDHYVEAGNFRLHYLHEGSGVECTSLLHTPPIRGTARILPLERSLERNSSKERLLLEGVHRHTEPRRVSGTGMSKR